MRSNGLRHLASVIVLALVSTGVAVGDIAGPAGIFVLGSARDNVGRPGDARLSNIRDFDFVDGYTLRVLWEDVETSPGVYNFNVIDQAIAQLQANQNATQLNLELLILSPPEHVTNAATETWEHFNAGVVPTPWDPVVQQAHKDLIAALASHDVLDQTTGATVPLAQHPTLVAMNASVPGLSSIRDNVGPSGLTKLVDLPSYDRQLFLDTVSEGVAVTRDAFADKHGFLGYFTMTDDQDAAFGESLDESLINRLMTDFNNPGQPTLGFFQELLSDVGPNPDSPLGRNLLAVADDTYVMFQALTSWQQPFRGEDNVTSMNPSNGIKLGYENYGATFFELYIADIDSAAGGVVDSSGEPLINGLRYWHDRLSSVPEPSAAALALVGLPWAMRRRA